MYKMIQAVYFFILIRFHWRKHNSSAARLVCRTLNAVPNCVLMSIKHFMSWFASFGNFKSPNGPTLRIHISVNRRNDAVFYKWSEKRKWTSKPNRKVSAIDDLKLEFLCKLQFDIIEVTSRWTIHESIDHLPKLHTTYINMKYRFALIFTMRFKHLGEWDTFATFSFLCCCNALIFIQFVLNFYFYILIFDLYVFFLPRFRMMF